MIPNLEIFAIIWLAALSIILAIFLVIAFRGWHRAIEGWKQSLSGWIEAVEEWKKAVDDKK